MSAITAATDAPATPAPHKQWYDPCLQVRFLGYPCEHHTARTADGFLLDVIRIPPKAANATSTYPVILQHGLFDSSNAWVANYHAYQSLACVLHDAGYDVFMPNSRGNHYSLNNTNYAPYTSRAKDLMYWQMVDVDEMAAFDVPACVDLAIAMQPPGGAKTVSWVGHSQGNYIAFAAFSQFPVVGRKVDRLFALGPTAFVGYAGGVAPDPNSTKAQQMDAFIALLRSVEAKGQILSLLEDDYFVHQFSAFCPYLGELCSMFLNIITGYSPLSNFNVSQMPSMTRFEPGGTSVSNLIHWVQAFVTGDFGMHDFGPATNKRFYNQTTPPQWPIAQIATDVVLFMSATDTMATPTCVAKTVSQMPHDRVVATYVVDNFNHLDFTWAVNAHTVVYPNLLAELAKMRAARH